MNKVNVLGILPSTTSVSKSLVWQYIAALVAVLTATFILFNLRSYLGDTNISLLYLLIVLFSATTARPSVTIFCGAISFFCYDFFLIPPIFDIVPHSPVKLLDPLAFFVVALVTSALAERSRQYAVEKATYQQASQFRTTLLQLVSHNLRTPLATIKTVLSTLVNSPLTPSLEMLSVAEQECDRLNRLIGNVLQLSRLDSNAVQLHKDWNGLDEVISTVFSHWPKEIAAQTLKASIPRDLPLIQFDFVLIEGVLTNLIENAFRHGEAPIHVKVEVLEDRVQTSVQDAGNGVPVADRSKLFQQFLSGSSGGLGLGLAVCKGLIEVHGGRLWADFGPQKTRFTFSLPLVTYRGNDDHDNEPHSGR
ncbi:MAG: ATP-binding protein [Chloroflexota bacterium]